MINIYNTIIKKDKNIKIELSGENTFSFFNYIFKCKRWLWYINKKKLNMKDYEWIYLINIIQL